MARTVNRNIALTLTLFAFGQAAAMASTVPVTKQRAVVGLQRVQPMRALASTDQAIDARLQAFAAANASNPQVQAALDAAAADIKQNPDAYVASNGTMNKAALENLLTQKFANAGPIVIPGHTPGSDNPAVLGSMGDGDIMAMCFIVMMDAAKSAREDLKSIMEGVKAINAQKAALRKALEEANQSATDCASDSNCSGKMDADARKEALQSKLDSEDQIGETMSNRMQMAQEHREKLMKIASDLLKKMSDTDSTILQNMK
jgi:hypothetical protein